MADAVTTQELSQLGAEWVHKFTNVSDGTGESAVLKVDVSGLTGGGVTTSRVQITKIIWSCAGMGVNILWDADTDVLAWALPTDTSGAIDFGIGPLKDPGATGATGDIKFTTVGHSSGDTYCVVLHFRRMG